METAEGPDKMPGLVYAAAAAELVAAGDTVDQELDAALFAG